MITRRNCLVLLSTVGASIVAKAQRATPVTIGFLSGASAAHWQPYVAAFKQGLGEAGYLEGKNVTIMYRWAEGRYERLPAMAREFVQQRVSVIVATAGGQTALAARNATSSIPIVFTLGSDPVALGLVQTLGRPGGNVTGATIFAPISMGKRLEVMHELLPKDDRIALLINPAAPAAPRWKQEALEAAPTFQQHVQVFPASTAEALEGAFRDIARQQFDGAIVLPDPVFDGEASRIVALAARHRLPTLYGFRENVVAGGLASYGPSLSEAYRQAGIYAGRILNGTSPSELPIVQPTRFELAINLKTARQLGVSIPRSLLARADELIE